MKKTILFIAFMVAFSAIANAKAIQVVYLKNGSILNGYIQMQDGRGKMSIETDSATICLDESDASINDKDAVAFDKLDSCWVKWANAHEVYIGDDNEKKLLLQDITMKPNADETTDKGSKKKDAVRKTSENKNGQSDIENEYSTTKSFVYQLRAAKKTFRNVYVLEKGAHIRFVEKTPNTYEVSWDDIVAIRSDKRSSNDLTGISRTYHLSSGEKITGEYAGETVNTISLYQESGVIETLKFADVVKYEIKGINPEQGLFEQSPLIDIVETNSTTFRGIIVKQDYSSDNDSVNSVSIMDKGYAEHDIKISEIKAIRREKNNEYKPLYDIIIKKGEVFVNRKPVEYVGVSEYEKKKENYLVLDSLASNDAIKSEGNTANIVLQYYNDSKSNVERFQIVKVEEIKIKKKSVYAFSYKDLATKSYRAKTTNKKHKCKAEFLVQGKGVFVIYDSELKKVIPIVIE